MMIIIIIIIIIITKIIIIIIITITIIITGYTFIKINTYGLYHISHNCQHYH